MKKAIYLLCGVLCFLTFMAGCVKDDVFIDSEIVGKWKVDRFIIAGQDTFQDATVSVIEEYRSDGTIKYILEGEKPTVNYTYWLDGDSLYMQGIHSDSKSKYTYVISGSELTLTLVEYPSWCLTGVPTVIVYERVK